MITEFVDIFWFIIGFHVRFEDSIFKIHIDVQEIHYFLVGLSSDGKVKASEEFTDFLFQDLILPGSFHR